MHAVDNSRRHTHYRTAPIAPSHLVPASVGLSRHGWRRRPGSIATDLLRSGLLVAIALVVVQVILPVVLGAAAVLAPGAR